MTMPSVPPLSELTDFLGQMTRSKEAATAFLSEGQMLAIKGTTYLYCIGVHAHRCVFPCFKYVLGVCLCVGKGAQCLVCSWIGSNLHTEAVSVVNAPVP